MRFGKWNMILTMNVLLIIGSIITLQENMWVTMAGKFVVGFAIGGIVVYTPAYIYDFVPDELKSQVGAVSNLVITIGIFIPALFGLGIPDPQDVDPESFAIQ
jgi:MFS family permease